MVDIGWGPQHAGVQECTELRWCMCNGATRRTNSSRSREDTKRYS